MIAIRKSSMRNYSNDLRSYFIEEGVMLVRVANVFQNQLPLLIPINGIQRYSKEWNQLVKICSTQEGTFTQVARQQGCLIPTVMRRFKT